MQLPELRMSFADRALLRTEVEQSLRCGRAFLSQPSPLPVLSDCVLVLVHPEHGGELRLPAQVVMANEHGTGLSLTTLSAQHLSDLNAFADSPPPTAADPTLTDAVAETPAAAPESTAAQAADEAQAPEDDDTDPLDESLDSLDFPRCDEQDLEYTESDGSAESGTEQQAAETRQERLRHLSPAEQLKVARRGELADRLAVERLYGKQVWEALLQNPRLTIPEVAKIARKGTVPRPLLDVIMDNAGWTKADAVRRALLSNPKIGPDAVVKLLRITPKHELKLIEKGTAYGAVVREAARKLLRQ
jgi:hypothetical protein